MNLISFAYSCSVDGQICLSFLMVGCRVLVSSFNFEKFLSVDATHRKNLKCKDKFVTTHRFPISQ